MPRPHTVSRTIFYLYTCRMRKTSFWPSFYLFLLLAVPGAAQNQHVIDSLQKRIDASTDDSVKIDAYFAMAQEYLFQPPKALEIAAKLKDMEIVMPSQRNKAICLRKTGNIYLKHKAYEKAVNCYLRSEVIYEKLKDKVGIANCFNNLGNTYTEQGNLTNNVSDFDRAIEYHNRALTIRLEINDVGNIPNSYNNIASAYSGKGDLEKALEFYNLALKVYKSMNGDNGIDMVTLNLGNTYLELGKKTGRSEYFGKSLEYYLDRIRAYQSFGSTNNHAEALSKIGEIYMLQGDMTRSLTYLQNALEMAIEINAKGERMEIEQLLSQAYYKKGDFKKAYESFRNYNSVKDSVINEKTAGSIAQMQTLFESAKKDREIEMLNKNKEIETIEHERKESELRLVILSTVGGLILLFGIALLLYNRNMIRKKANSELKDAYQKIEHTNKQITDSINYAKRIQDAILVPEDVIQKTIPGFFVYFRPRDIVSGDFYWFSRNKDKTFIAVADCTGHGVPGAFMSMIGNTLLNEIVNHKGVTDPGKILEELNDGVIAALRQNNTDLLSQDDGMDISICVLGNGNVEFAGANHSIYLVQQGHANELKGDIHSIGGSMGGSKRTFTTKTLPVSKGTFVFMSTDGYYDQFGGEQGSKFLTTRFEKLIVEAAANNSPKEVIEKTFLGWKGNNRQIDDVLVAGFKL